MDEVQVDFGKALREVHADFGGNMVGFVLLCIKKDPAVPLAEMKSWFGGADELRISLIVEAAKLTLDKIMADNQCSVLEGMKILTGKVLERKFMRDRQFREQQGKR
jgi:hypothetical protein